MKALIAMSGGVDSSVAALLMKNKGYDCIGCTMKLFDNNDAGVSESRTCCSLDDVEDARSVAFRLGIPYYVFNFSEEFREKIIGKFISSYENGMTPNPCIDCNRYMKFEKLLARAEILGCEYLVTGHYARIARENGRFVLKKALDDSKDQSYVLYTLTQEQLGHVMFPLGSLTKQEARNIAEKNGFVNADKPDSQDICFVPDGNYASVIERHTGKSSQPGCFVGMDGNVLGYHKGIIHYTVGQRRGLGISSTEPLYVCGIDKENNAIILGRRQDLFKKETDVTDINWISGEVPSFPVCCKVKIRYRHSEQPATVMPDGNGAHIVFDEPQRAITPGQSAVFYDGDTVLGGGTII